MLAALIFPHQLFEHHPALKNAEACVLIEDPLFFRQYRFHAQKLLLHRASMQHYAGHLRLQGFRVFTIASSEFLRHEDAGKILRSFGITRAQFTQLNDDWLEQRWRSSLENYSIPTTELPDPHFLTPNVVFDEMADRRKWFFTDFYMAQRKRLNLLLESGNRPTGGKWSFDVDNRSRLPKNIALPEVHWPDSKQFPQDSSLTAENSVYVMGQFPERQGSLQPFRYPVTHEQARHCLQDFLDHRFADFGVYEDAISSRDAVLFHSMLTPALNTGLLSPKEVVDAALERSGDVPMNSLEGFIRQIIGWREYMRGVYYRFGRSQRCSNFWDHQARLPASFYDGSTGIEPVDTVIRRVLSTGYCHHIERLMILGNLMLLCEIHPDDVYQWFMELFIDAYDWVMVPNVYGMSQFADGGRITTKPYISGSSYVLRMSNFRRGDWCPIWDALYWRFIDRHRDFFAGNPRMSVMVRQLDKMGAKLHEHHKVADRFLDSLHGRTKS